MDLQGHIVRDRGRTLNLLIERKLLNSCLRRAVKSLVLLLLLHWPASCWAVEHMDHAPGIEDGSKQISSFYTVLLNKAKQIKPNPSVDTSAPHLLKTPFHTSGRTKKLKSRRDQCQEHYTHEYLSRKTRQRPIWCLAAAEAPSPTSGRGRVGARHPCL